MTNCTCHPGHTCTSVESCAAARRAEFGDVADYEKRIRDASEEGPYYTAMVAKPDLRALLADLDAMRGALERISCAAKATVSNPEWISAHADAALKGAAHE